MTTQIFSINKKNIIKIFIIVVIFIIFSWLIIGVNSLYEAYNFGKEAPFENPPKTLQEEDLIGVWKIDYSGEREETTKLNSDLTYSQIYEENYSGEDYYKFETSSNVWWIEHLSDGRVYLHLEKAKYFLDGSKISEMMGGYLIPCPDDIKENEICNEGVIHIPFNAFDWITREFVNMSNELILNVRMTSEGEIILMHLWTSGGDQGFPILFPESQIFMRSEDN